MEKKLSVTSNVKWLAGANLVVKPFWFLFLLASTRILGAEQFGLYMFAVSFIAVITIFVEAGIDIHTIRELSADENIYQKYVAHSLFIKSTGIILILTATYIALHFVSVPGSMNTLIVLAAIYGVLNILIVHARAIFRAYEVMHYEAISIVLEKGFVIVICIIFLSIMNTAASFMIGFVIAYFITCFITIWIVFKKIGMPKWEIDYRYLWRKIIKPAFPYALMNIFTVIYFRSGTLILNALTGKEQLVGYFNAGYRLVESYMLFPSIVAGPIYPLLVRGSKYGTDISHILLQAVRFILLTSVFIVLPVFLFKNEFTYLFFGNDYMAASNSVGIIIISIIPIGMNFVFGTLVAASGRQKLGNYFIVCVTIINLAVNFILIPRYGVIGASITTVVTEGLLAGANIWIVRDFVPWSEFMKILAKITMTACIVILLFYSYPLYIKFPFNVIIVVIMLVALFFIFKILTMADLRKITGLYENSSNRQKLG